MQLITQIRTAVQLIQNNFQPLAKLRQTQIKIVT